MDCTNTHLADGLELLVILVVAGQQEAPVGARPLAFSQVGANHTEVHCVAHPLQVVLFKLRGGQQHDRDITVFLMIKDATINQGTINKMESIMTIKR